jgi:signal-transduction protein with cAMP-binding, CBS, and nucleotidyltransferase domain
MASSRQRKVAELRPKAALSFKPDELVSVAAKQMQLANADAAIVLDDSGMLLGIFTDSDVVSKVRAPVQNATAAPVSLASTAPLLLC